MTHLKAYQALIFPVQLQA